MDEKKNQVPQEKPEKKKVGKEKKKYEQSRPVEDKKIRLVFKHNRTFELHIGRNIYRFEGRESKYVPESVLEHKDFTQEIRNYFVIGE